MVTTTAKFDRKSWALTGANSWYYNRRIWTLSRARANASPGRGSVLDIGCGDGQLALARMKLRPDLKIEGVDVLARPKTLIPVSQYNGTKLPFADKSFDYVTIVDVLHHTDAPTVVLAEASRVARHGVVIKDHLREGLLAQATLAFIDWCGNFGDGVGLCPHGVGGTGTTRRSARRATVAGGMRMASRSASKPTPPCSAIPRS